MDQEQKEMVQRWIEEAIAPLREELTLLKEGVAEIRAKQEHDFKSQTALTASLETLEQKVDHVAGIVDDSRS